MTREDHLEFCRRCHNRKFDPSNGIVCSLTGQIAAFKENCEQFNADNSVVVTVDDKTALDSREIKSKLPPEIYERLRLEQNLTMAVLAGLLTAVVCAILWAAFTVYTERQFWAMGLMVGVAVGYAMRKGGKGIDHIFGFWGAGISLFGCLLGNFLSVIGFVAHLSALGYFETLLQFEYTFLPDLMAETFDVRQILIYGVAIVIGFGLAKRTITDKDIKTFKEMQKRPDLY
jgi:hypothetical protein